MRIASFKKSFLVTYYPIYIIFVGIMKILINPILPSPHPLVTPVMGEKSTHKHYVGKIIWHPSPSTIFLNMALIYTKSIFQLFALGVHWLPLVWVYLSECVWTRYLAFLCSILKNCTSVIHSARSWRACYLRRF